MRILYSGLIFVSKNLQTVQPQNCIAIKLQAIDLINDFDVQADKRSSIYHWPQANQSKSSSHSNVSGSDNFVFSDFTNC